MSSHNIFIFGKTDVGNNRFPFGSELKEKQEFISPQIHPFIKNGVNLKLLKCGESHTIIISTTNEVILFGDIDGALTTNINQFKWKFDEIVEVGAGCSYNLMLTSSGD